MCGRYRSLGSSCVYWSECLVYCCCICGVAESTTTYAMSDPILNVTGSIALVQVKLVSRPRSPHAWYIANATHRTGPTHRHRGRRRRSSCRPRSPVPSVVITETPYPGVHRDTGIAVVVYRHDEEAVAVTLVHVFTSATTYPASVNLPRGQALGLPASTTRFASTRNGIARCAPLVFEDVRRFSVCRIGHCYEL